MTDFKYSIPIPVPLGTKLYEFDTDCCNACYVQKNLRKNIALYPETKQLACSHTAPCHTRFRRVDSFEFTISNLEYVLKFWNTRVFTTPEEAEAAGRKLVEQHIKEMQEMGYAIKDDGTYEEEVVEEYKNSIKRS